MGLNITTVDDIKIVFGLDWVPLAGEGKEKTEVREYVREHDIAYQVRCAGDHSIIYGYMSRESVPDDEKKVVVLSAAMLLATKDNLPNRAIFLHVEAQTASVIIVEGGVPSPGGDFHGSIQDVQDIISQVQGDSQEIFTIFSANTDLYDNALPMTLSELLSDGDQEQSKLVKSSKGIDGKILVLVSLSVVMCIGYFGYQYYEQDKKAKALAASRAKPVIDPNKLYANAVKSAFSTAGLDGPSAALRFAEVPSGVNTLVAGWELKNIDCSSEACTFLWRINGGTNSTFTAAMGKNDYQYGVDGSHIQYVRPLEKTIGASVGSDALPNFKQFLLSFGSFAQRIQTIGLKVSIEPPTLFGDVTGISVQALKEPIRSGHFYVEGPQALSHDVMSVLPKYIAVSAYHIKLESASPTFKVEGSYYVKN